MGVGLGAAGPAGLGVAGAGAAAAGAAGGSAGRRGRGRRHDRVGLGNDVGRNVVGLVEHQRHLVVEDDVDPFLLGNLVDDRLELVLEVALEVRGLTLSSLAQALQLALAVLDERLAVAVLLDDLLALALLRLGADDGPLLLELVLESLDRRVHGLQLFLLRVALRIDVLAQGLELRGVRLAELALGRDTGHVDDGDLGRLDVARGGRGGRSRRLGQEPR